jgi:hypothetical protein
MRNAGVFALTVLIPAVAKERASMEFVFTHCYSDDGVASSSPRFLRRGAGWGRRRRARPPPDPSSDADPLPPARLHGRPEAGCGAAAGETGQAGRAAAAREAAPPARAPAARKQGRPASHSRRRAAESTNRAPRGGRIRRGARLHGRDGRDPPAPPPGSACTAACSPCARRFDAGARAPRWRRSGPASSRRR